MATKTISRLFDNHDDALAAVRDLEAAGFSAADIGIAAANEDNRYTSVADKEEAKSGAGVGATVGTLVGGGAGLAAALGALAIPGFGPIVAAGVLAATLTGAGAGAAAGGIIGSLTGLGISESEAHVYAEGIRRGGSLVTVKIDDSRELEARTILDRYSYVDLAAREADYRASGWTGYVETPDRPIGR
ncbi:hypothetical protein [Roseococcus sp. YIM B11640]|uniref:hypothetical protein n=1 Tax=Roseococcus sp. YIM B11640 TaxID=3133973 RepID=UPI003C7AD93D